MKFLNKILILLVVLIFAMGFVAATSVHDFTYPNTFTKIDDGDGYVNNEGQGMIVFEYDAATKSLFLSDHDNYAHTYYEDNLYLFSDGESNLAGIFEVVEFHGDKFIVLSTILPENIETDTLDAYDNLMEFNELNNVKPLSI